MNAIDIVLALPMCWMIYKGWRRGLVREAATLLGVLAGIWAAVHLSQTLAEQLDFGGEATLLVAFFICFVGALVVAYLLGRMVEGLMKAAHVSIVNRVLGALAGLVSAVCVLAVLINYISMLDSKGTLIGDGVKNGSILYKPVYNTGNHLTASLKQYVADHREEWKEALL